MTHELKCKNCQTVKPEKRKLKCYSCNVYGCNKCIEIVCSDCSERMCKNCNGNEKSQCGCYGKCSLCEINVDRGSNGWPCNKCKKWYCEECKNNSKCNECNVEYDD